jgi:hypothetical protein
MSTKKYIPVLMLLLISLLASCGPGKSKLIGRWEHFSNDDHTAGTVMEFYHDGSCLAYDFPTPAEFLYPPISGENISKYSVRFGTLILTGGYRKQTGGGGWNTPDTGTAGTGRESIDYKMTFVSDDELSLLEKGQTEAMTFQRAPLPEMPLDARTVLGSRLQNGNSSVVSAERLVGNWQDQFPGYVEVDSKYYVPVQDPEQWAVVVQTLGQPHPRILILVEGESWWGVIILEKME